MKTQRRIYSFVIVLLLLASLGSMACSSGSRRDFLEFPAHVAVDSINGRVFVVDQQGQGLNLILASNNDVVENPDSNNDSLLGDDPEEDPNLLPDFPSDAAVATLAATSRLFIIGGRSGSAAIEDELDLEDEKEVETPVGASNGEFQEVTILDFDEASGLRTAAISPVSVSDDAADILSGIVVDQERNRFLVSNKTAGQIHVFDVDTGAEQAGSPIVITGQPTRLAVDQASDLLAVANSENTQVTLIDLTNLSVLGTLEVGVRIRDVTLVTNGGGTALFLSGINENVALGFLLDLANLANSTSILEIRPDPVAPVEDFDDRFEVLVNGTINRVLAANIAGAQVLVVYTLSSGDLLSAHLNADFTSPALNRTEVGAVTGEDIDGLFATNGELINFYFASTGVSTLTVLEPALRVDNEDEPLDVVDQIP